MRTFFDVYQLYAILYCISLLYLLINRKKTHLSTELLWINVLLLVIVFNPFFVKYIVNTLLNGLTWRAYWLLPVTIMIAYAGVLVKEHFSLSVKKICLVLCIWILFLVNAFTFTSSNYAISQNAYKLPQGCIDVCDYILAQDERAKIIVPSSLYSYIRQYTAKIDLLYGRNIEGYMNGVYDSNILTVANIMKQKSASTDDFVTMSSIAVEYGCSYLVLDTKTRVYPTYEEMDTAGFTYLETINQRYDIYKIKGGE